MKIAIACQRFGPDIVGGAEYHARELAQQLAAKGHSVEIYTSCARSYRTWANELPEGITQDGKVLVRRFRTIMPRLVLLQGLLGKILFKLISWQKKSKENIANNPAWKKSIGRIVLPLQPAIEWLWVRAQGPYSPSLVKALTKEASRFDRVILFTYLYYPTLALGKNLKGNFFLIPTAHDEPPFRMQAVESLMLSAKRIICNIEPEAELIIATHSDSESSGASSLSSLRDKIRIGAYGLEFKAGRQENSAHEQAAASVRQRLDLLYLGRIGPAKGIHTLLRSLAEIGGDATRLRLHLAGKIESGFTLPKSDFIEYHGFVSDPEKQCLIESADAIINPSTHESLSIIALEGLLNRKPLILNLRCPIFQFYCEKLSTALGYKNAAELKEVISKLWNAPPDADSLNQSQNWAKERFTWDRVCENLDLRNR